MGYRESAHAKAVELVRLVVRMTTEAGSGHPTSAASLAHLATVLLYDHMVYDPARPSHPRADRLVLSEGHACPIVYAAAADLGMGVVDGSGRRRPLETHDLGSLRRLDSILDGHPNPAEGFPFFPAATGSLGQGLSIAAGLALAARLDGFGNRIFCIVGDGESREGQIWEAVDFIVEEELHGVCPIFNCNGFGQTGAVSAQQSPATLARKLEAAGMMVRLIDGHDPLQIREALDQHARVASDIPSRPLAIVARTVKGWGTPSLQGKGHHGKAVAAKELDRVMAELDATAKGIHAGWTDGDLRIPSIPEEPIQEPVAPVANAPGTLSEAIARYGGGAELDDGRMATRDAYGLALRALGEREPHLVVLDGDVSNSTRSNRFQEDPVLASRFYQCGIAEQNMISCAVGLAAGGKLPFVSTFGKFMSRAADQLEMTLISRAGVKLVGSHAGATPSPDGPSQMALADLAFFRAFTTVRTASGEPLLHVLNPSDAVSAYALTLAMASHRGACYLRTLRPAVPVVHDEETEFRPGGHHLLRKGSDLLIAAAGWMVHRALSAAGALENQGISAAVLDLYSLPFDEESLLELARESGGAVLVLEDNYGPVLGSAVADVLAGSPGDFVLEQLHIRKIPKSARKPDRLFEHLGLGVSDVVRSARDLLQTA